MALFEVLCRPRRLGKLQAWPAQAPVLGNTGPVSGSSVAVSKAGTSPHTGYARERTAGQPASTGQQPEAPYTSESSKGGANAGSESV
jgi:hypothetical protein